MENLNWLKRLELMNEDYKERLVIIDSCLDFEKYNVAVNLINDEVNMICQRLIISSKTPFSQTLRNIKRFYEDVKTEIELKHYKSAKAMLNDEIEMINEELRNSDNVIG